VIGRGHSGTRAISQTLYASGVYMGDLLNASGDMMPPEAMYDACRVFAKYVKWQGDLNWDFEAIHNSPIPAEFTELVEKYLAKVLKRESGHKGWKLPETTLVYPWIRRMFPETKFIFWIRNPRDCIIGSHITDDMNDFGIQYPEAENVRMQRAISWLYQYELIKSTPAAKNWIEVRFEDFVLNQEETLQRLEDFLGIPLARIIVKPEAVARWKNDNDVNYFDFFKPAMEKHNYEIPN
ncbi:MAG: sulfotransferase, partial [Lentisphaerae bacterium]|nr:sulfotransferase [Lentisphaerota bacterium]